MLASIPLHIPKDLFEPAATRRFEGDAPTFDVRMGGDQVVFEGPSHWQVDVTNTGGALLVSGTVESSATCACARCLEDATYDVTGEIEGYYLIAGEDADIDGVEKDEFETLPDDETIDLAPLIQGALVLEVPQVPLCKDDCAGLCPQCGKNLNEGACDCEPISDDASSSPFAVLKDLKIE